MTPAIRLLKKQKIPHTVHEYKHDTSVSSYGEEAAQKMGVQAGRVFKTLVVQSDKMLAVGIVPVSSKLSLKNMAKALGVKKVAMADPKDVENATGYILGGVSPLGQKKRLKTVIDESAFEYDSVFVSAGRRGLEVELSASDLKKLLQAVYAEIAGL
ncbi:Cys-tRNA(Pro) deacylase [Sulfurimonas sp.]|uniref:Cys-tRNA(Pro) deacylase n=1 Tax=Sulfurimonas sp. TaxID=2022749 RepID=UPI003561CE3E